MDDLISRSVLKKAFSKNSIFEKITDARGKNVLEIIDEQPTAYSVEKVEKQIEEMFGCDPMYYGTEVKWAVDKAIEIVKAGGVE